MYPKLRIDLVRHHRTRHDTTRTSTRMFWLTFLQPGP
jgi:hypothetical protein